MLNLSCRWIKWPSFKSEKRKREIWMPTWPSHPVALYPPPPCTPPRSPPLPPLPDYNLNCRHYHHHHHHVSIAVWFENVLTSSFSEKNLQFIERIKHVTLKNLIPCLQTTGQLKNKKIPKSGFVYLHKMSLIKFYIVNAKMISQTFQFLINCMQVFWAWKFNV